MAQPIIYFEIVGDNAALLRRYYTELFGWEFDHDNPPRGFDYAAVSADGIGISGAIGAAPPGTGGYLTFYVEVPDVDAALAHAQQLGGTRIYGPDRVSDMLEIGMFTDPEGHVVGVLAVANHADPNNGDKQ
jgi:uncharacterized protein